MRDIRLLVTQTHRSNESFVLNRSSSKALSYERFVIILVQLFFAVFFPVLTTLNISSSETPLTLGSGTPNRAAFSDRFCLIAEDSPFAFFSDDLSSRYCGRGVEDGSAVSEDLMLRSSCALMVFFIWIFSLWRFCWYSLARRPRRFCEFSEAL